MFKSVILSCSLPGGFSEFNDPSSDLISLLFSENRNWGKSIFLFQAEGGSLEWDVLTPKIFIFPGPLSTFLTTQEPKKNDSKNNMLPPFRSSVFFCKYLHFKEGTQGYVYLS